MNKDNAEKLVDQFMVVIKEARTQQGISMTELGARAGIEHSNISRMEYMGADKTKKRRPTLATAILLANALDLKMSEIMVKLEL